MRRIGRHVHGDVPAAIVFAALVVLTLWIALLDPSCHPRPGPPGSHAIQWR